MKYNNAKCKHDIKHCRAEVLGEIAYLRALAYFNILVRYCEFWDMNSEYGVVMRNEAPSVSNALKARSSVADSYQYILDQLEIAIEKAPDWKKAFTSF